MIQIEVQNEAVRTRTIQSQKGTFQTKEQAAWAFLFDVQGNEDPYPTRITLRLDEDHSGYPQGTYYLAPQSIYLKDRFGNLALGRPVLIAENDYHARFLAPAA